jgi:hypothetical protein
VRQKLLKLFLYAALDRKNALYYIANKIQERFTPEELSRLSRVVLIDQTNPGLDAIHQAVSIEHGVADIQNRNFFGLPIKHANIITSQKPDLKLAAAAI